jgi:hypothetical protein
MLRKLMDELIFVLEKENNAYLFEPFDKEKILPTLPTLCSKDSVNVNS